MIYMAVSVLISVLPFQSWKRFFYKIIFQYSIDKHSHIGFFSVIVCKKLTIIRSKVGPFNFLHANRGLIKGSQIGIFNVVRNVNSFQFLEGSTIHKFNKFFGTKNTKMVQEVSVKTQENIIVGYGSVIGRDHYFDLNDEICIGKNVVIGGFDTQFWTHGFTIDRKKVRGAITIGDNVYVGSRCFFTQGISVADNSSISGNTTVHKSIVESGFYVSNALTKKG